MLGATSSRRWSRWPRSATAPCSKRPQWGVRSSGSRLLSREKPCVFPILNTSTSSNQSGDDVISSRSDIALSKIWHGGRGGYVTRDDVTIHRRNLSIGRSKRGWSLEVVDQEGGSTVWNETFSSDTEAYAEFHRTLEKEGIRSFAERPSGRAH
jgi:hypothetical protein